MLRPMRGHCNYMSICIHLGRPTGLTGRVSGLHVVRQKFRMGLSQEWATYFHLKEMQVSKDADGNVTSLKGDSK